MGTLIPNPGAIDALNSNIGTLSNLNTSSKENLVNAVNETYNRTSAVSSDTTTSGFAFYRMGKIVMLSIVKSMTTSQQTASRAIPSTMRPRTTVRCVCVSDNGKETARVTLKVNGDIEYQGSSSETYYGEIMYLMN